MGNMVIAGNGGGLAVYRSSPGMAPPALVEHATLDQRAYRGFPKGQFSTTETSP
jgi:hypothetical protein